MTENDDVAKQRLEEFDAIACGQKYSAIAQAWRRQQVIPFLSIPQLVRKITGCRLPAKAII